jgi:predicted tellurium resistance membrane protein TerC
MFEIATAVLTLTLLEIVLGIDNIIVIAIMAGKLPAAQQPRARRLGLAAALVTRLLLLASLSYILGLTKPILTLPELPFFQAAEAREISWRDLILIVGGLFLIGKSTYEIHDKLENPDEPAEDAKPRSKAGFAGVIVQIALVDIIFSLDSVITAVGMVNENIKLPGGGEFNRLWVMVIAVVVSVGVMLIFAGPISNFIGRNPTLKILALSFLILIGVLLVADGFGQHMNKGYIYFAMAFSVCVEMVNLRIRRKSKPIQLRGEKLPPGS